MSLSWQISEVLRYSWMFSDDIFSLSIVEFSTGKISSSRICYSSDIDSELITDASEEVGPPNV